MVDVVDEPFLTVAHVPAFLRFENLSKAYQEGDRTRVVLSEADADFAKGEFVAILGRSGRGKSTLLNLISGIDRARQRPHLARRAGAQRPGRPPAHPLSPPLDRLRLPVFKLIPTLTVWKNVILPLELNGAPMAEIRQRAEPLLDAVGLLDPVKPSPTGSPAANSSAWPSLVPWSTSPNWS